MKKNDIPYFWIYLHSTTNSKNLVIKKLYRPSIIWPAGHINWISGSSIRLSRGKKHVELFRRSGRISLCQLLFSLWRIRKQLLGIMWLVRRDIHTLQLQLAILRKFLNLQCLQLKNQRKLMIFEFDTES